MSFEQKLAYDGFVPEIICLGVHSVCAVFVCWYVYQFRGFYPYRQNSPILTIWSQIFLLIASVTLFTSKIEAQNQGLYPNFIK